MDPLRAFAAAVAPLVTLLPMRISYETTTRRGRAVQVLAEYDPGWADSVGPVDRYARILRVLDRKTQQVLVDGSVLMTDDGLTLDELEQLEESALASCELQALSGQGFRH